MESQDQFTSEVEQIFKSANELVSRRLITIFEEKLCQLKNELREELKTDNDRKIEDLTNSLRDEFKQEISQLKNKQTDQDNTRKNTAEQAKESQEVVKSSSATVTAVVNNVQPQQVQPVQPMNQVTVLKPDQAAQQKLNSKWGDVFGISGIGAQNVQIRVLNAEWAKDIDIEDVLKDLFDCYEENNLEPFKGLYYEDNPQSSKYVSYTIHPGQDFPALCRFDICLGSPVAVNDNFDRFVSQFTQHFSTLQVLTIYLNLHHYKISDGYFCRFFSQATPQLSSLLELTLHLSCLTDEELLEIGIKFGQNFANLKTANFYFHGHITDSGLTNFATQFTQNPKNLQTLRFDFDPNLHAMRVDLHSFTSKITQKFKSLHYFWLYPLSNINGRNAYGQKELLDISTEIITNLKELKALVLNLVGLTGKDVVTLATQIAQNLRSLQVLSLNFGGNFAAKLDREQNRQIKKLLEYIPNRHIDL